MPADNSHLIVAEPEPGLFTYAKPTPAAPEANSN